MNLQGEVNTRKVIDSVAKTDKIIDRITVLILAKTTRNITITVITSVSINKLSQKLQTNK